MKSLARKLRARLTTFQECSLDADILWLAVPDDAIADCVARLAARRALRGKIVLHSSGALSSEVLEPVRRAGASTASLHPMMSFSSGNRAPDLRGVWFSVEGEAVAVRVARRIVKDLGGHRLAVKAVHKALYHAFGAMIAPLLVSHLEAAERMAKRAGLDAATARRVMKPIAEKVLDAFVAGGAAPASSGPFLRGDVKTVERHLRALRGTPEDMVYRILAEYAVTHLKVANREGLKKILR